MHKTARNRLLPVVPCVVDNMQPKKLVGEGRRKHLNAEGKAVQLI